MLRVLQAGSTEAGATRSHIVYMSGLNYVRCERYIDLLTRKGLFTYTKPSLEQPGVYKITGKGRETLETLLEVRQVLYGEEILAETSPDLVILERV